MANLLDKYVLVYIDSILIYLRIAENYVAHIKAVFERLVAKNLLVNEKKCALFLPEVESLGHVVFAVGVKVAVDKVDAVVL